MSKVTLFFLTYGGRTARLIIHLVGIALDPDGTDVAALREIISRLSAALGRKATVGDVVVVASGGVNITATTSPYSDDQDKATMIFASAEGTFPKYQISSPIDMFLADHERVNTANAAFLTWKAAAEALFVSPSGGALTFRRGVRSRTMKGGRA